MPFWRKKKKVVIKPFYGIVLINMNKFVPKRYFGISVDPNMEGTTSIGYITKGGTLKLAINFKNYLGNVVSLKESRFIKEKVDGREFRLIVGDRLEIVNINSINATSLGLTKEHQFGKGKIISPSSFEKKVENGVVDYYLKGEKLKKPVELETNLYITPLETLRNPTELLRHQRETYEAESLSQTDEIFNLKKSMIGETSRLRKEFMGMGNELIDELTEYAEELFKSKAEGYPKFLRKVYELMKNMSAYGQGSLREREKEIVGEKNEG